MKKITRQKLSIVNGTEGPSHDPYSYDILTFENNLKKVELKLGLIDWIKFNGQQIKVTREDIFNDNEIYQKLHELFLQHTGLTVDQFMKAYNRIKNPKHCPNCESSKKQWYSGFPGEEFMACGQCGKVLDYHFNMGAII